MRVKAFFFQRLLHLLAENHHRCFIENKEAATNDLKAVLCTISGSTPLPDLSLVAMHCSQLKEDRSDMSRVSFDRLHDTYLFSDEEWSLLMNLGLIFDTIKESCNTALEIFLILLYLTPLNEDQSLIDYFSALLDVDFMGGLFLQGWIIKDQTRILSFRSRVKVFVVAA